MVVHDGREPRAGQLRLPEQGPPPLRDLPSVSESVSASFASAEPGVHLHDEEACLHRLRGRQRLGPAGPVGHGALRARVGVGGTILHGLRRYTNVVNTK